MNEVNLAHGQLGSVGDYEVKFDKAQLVISAEAKHGALESKVSLSVDATLVLDALAAAIPGKVDDTVIALIKTAILGG